MYGVSSNFLSGSLNPLNILKVAKHNFSFRKSHPEYFDPEGLMIFCGEQGSGKTLSAVQYVKKLCFSYPDVTGVCDLPDGVEMCMPGDNIEMTIELIHPVAMEQGLTFAIREGGRTVGSGRVATIIE